MHARFDIPSWHGSERHRFSGCRSHNFRIVPVPWACGRASCDRCRMMAKSPLCPRIDELVNVSVIPGIPMEKVAATRRSLDHPAPSRDARRRKEGLLERAHGGTLFVDEIGNMSPASRPNSCGGSGRKACSGSRSEDILPLALDWVQSFNEELKKVSWDSIPNAADLIVNYGRHREYPRAENVVGRRMILAPEGDVDSISLPEQIRESRNSGLRRSSRRMIAIRALTSSSVWGSRKKITSAKCWPPPAITRLRPHKS